ncbi:MAG TPA: hypothetical protein VM265_06815 [Sphingomicrobium sp.]|nr:hypothetical protein [Sphingomicrobium sp.]
MATGSERDSGHFPCCSQARAAALKIARSPFPAEPQARQSRCFNGSMEREAVLGALFGDWRFHAARVAELSGY